MNALARVLAPFNNRAVSLSGVGLITTSAGALVKNMTDAAWLQNLWFAMHGSGALAADKMPLFQLAAVNFGFLLGAIALYVGAPWWVKPTAPPPSNDGEAVLTPFKLAA